MTRLAYSIVTLYGMNDAIGNRSYPSNNQVSVRVRVRVLTRLDPYLTRLDP